MNPASGLSRTGDRRPCRRPLTRMAVRAAAAWLLSVAAGAAPGAATNDAAVALSTGNEATVDLPMSGGTMKVYLPSNYAPDQTWPAVFFYHGMGGAPTTAFIRQLTGGRDYIVAGMPYLESGVKDRTPDENKAYMRRELENLHRARAWLTGRARVNERRVYLAGVSKGGWMAGSLAEMETQPPAGMIILLAGRTRYNPPPPAGWTIRNKPVYVGAGENDPNMPVARMAVEFYRNLGALVTFEEYMGAGHEVPPEPPLLKAWLEAHGPLEGRPAADPAAVKIKEALQKMLDEARATDDPVKQLCRLRGILDDPRLSLCWTNGIADVSTLLRPLLQKSPTKEEWLAEDDFKVLLRDEMNIKYLNDMKKLKDGYQKLMDTYPQTRFGKMAQKYYEAVAKAYDKSVEATRLANPDKGTNKTAPAGAPSIPFSAKTGATDSRGGLVPVKKGDKIIYKRTTD